MNAAIMDGRNVKVGIVPGRIVDVNYQSAETTVAQLFDMAGIDLPSGGLSVRVNGVTVESMDTELGILADGSTVYASATIKGN